MNLKKLKKEDGITGVDIGIAVLIVMLMTGIIASIFYNNYITAVAVERSDTAMNICVNVLEYALETNYTNVDNTLRDKYIASKGSFPKGYTVTATVEKFSDTNVGKEDIIKTVRVVVSYPVGKKTETVDIKTIKTKE